MTMYTGPEKEFGYFVYAPDGFAYAPKYAASYAEKVNQKKGYSFEKKAVTYIMEEPPPHDNPYMLAGWWVKNKAKIDKKPASVQSFANGYKVEKYLLTEKEQAISTADDIDLGIHFR